MDIAYDHMIIICCHIIIAMISFHVYHDVAQLLGSLYQYEQVDIIVSKNQALKYYTLYNHYL